ALTLIIAANYGGRWDMTQACKVISQRVASGELSPCAINEAVINEHLCLADLAEPDLFIRTGGEQRVSNFMLWQLAYTEFYFTQTLWPDFNQAALQEAIASFQTRQRRFGHTGEQIAALATP
ncbi:MAG: polyprenyl diphosphate synthase, partial [Methylococcales bacterium]|nr:polyprenyl diphosphate synthase [Methylococcales bacterium]